MKDELKATICLLFLFTLFNCSKSEPSVRAAPKPDAEIPPSILKGFVWEETSLIRISDPDQPIYNGYARLKQLDDGSLICVYESGGNILAKKSEDSGVSWSAAILADEKEPALNMTTPDLIQLQNGSMLLCYGSRPLPDNTDINFRYAIKIKKSYDKGITWEKEQTIYEAGTNSRVGCWEPSALQLPSGEIQLFFSNEGIYALNNDQNISILRSQDDGATWSEEPEIVSYREGGRDGMPSPILLKDTNEIVFSIEDNHTPKFKPYTIRTTIAENWETIVSGNSSKREYALSDPLAYEVYAGAPYLAQLSSGEVLLSYQGTEDRMGNDLENAEMKVVIGDNQARNFRGKSVPFNLPNDKSGLWNSITVLNDDTIIALTSTSAFSSVNSVEVWAIKGKFVK
ncbi:MAG: hypothetical protein ACI815_002112 [Psychroserpens sp.]|jgi:hypothetical protein